MARRVTTPRSRARKANGATLEPPPPGVGWWGDDGPAPSVQWPGVTLDLPATWAGERGRWESPDGTYYFDETEAARAVAFFPTFLTHHIGEFNGRPFDLLPYQAKLLTRPLFGWKRAADDLRRFRKVFAFIPKGAGKSPWAAGTGLYLLFCDGEAAAEVYAIASDKLQARTVHDNAKIMVEQSRHLAGRAEVLRDSIYVPATRSVYQVLAAEALSAHGKRPHAVILDEFHTQRNRDLFEAFRKSLAKRRQPLMVLISHAGDDDESICYEEYELAKQVLSGSHPDETCLPVIFEAAPGDDWTAPAVWRKVNPGHGITIQHDGIATEALEAQAEPRKLNDFLRFHLNRWTNSAVAWIPVDAWDRCAAPLPPPEVLAECPVAVGIDLSQKYDLTAVVAAFRLPLDDAVPEADVEVVAVDEAGQVVRRSLSLNYRIALVPAFWLPDETLVERVHHDRVPYDLFRDLGELRTTEGAVIDSDAVVRYITAELAVRYPLVKAGDLGYDPAFATELSIRLQAQGFRPVELLQNFKQLSEASQVFEALVRARRVIHGGNRLLRWQLENTSIKRDDAGRIRPVKPRKAAKRIDGIVASIMAINRLLVQTPPPPPPKYQMLIF
jgi:phage terminase large subunit-like protein